MMQFLTWYGEHPIIGSWILLLVAAFTIKFTDYGMVLIKHWAGIK